MARKYRRWKKVDLADLMSEVDRLVGEIAVAQDGGDEEGMHRPIGELRSLIGRPPGSETEPEPAAEADDHVRQGYARFTVGLPVFRGSWHRSHWQVRERILSTLQAQVVAQVGRGIRNRPPVPRTARVVFFTRRPWSYDRMMHMWRCFAELLEITGLAWAADPTWIHVSYERLPAGHAAPHAEVEVWDVGEEIWSEAQRRAAERAQRFYDEHPTYKAVRRRRERAAAKKTRRGLLVRDK